MRWTIFNFIKKRATQCVRLSLEQETLVSARCAGLDVCVLCQGVMIDYAIIYRVAFESKLKLFLDKKGG